MFLCIIYVKLYMMSLNIDKKKKIEYINYVK